MESQYVPLDWRLGDAVPPSEVLRVSPGEAPRHYAWVPTPSVRDLTYTTDGIAGVMMWDPVTDEHALDRLVWIEEGAAPSDRLRAITHQEAWRHPSLAGLIGPLDAPLTIATPAGRRVVQRPETFSDIRVSMDGRDVVYLMTVTTEGTLQDEIHAISAETGHERILAADQDVDDAQVAGGRLAYRTTDYPANELCIRPITP
jgi:hypothetical protein